MKNQGLETNTVENEVFKQTRRRVLLWTPPVISAMALPVHAQMTECPLTELVISGPPSKCSGSPPIGTATLTLTSPDATIPVEILSITHDASGDNIISGDTSGTITSETGLDIFWEGPATDGLTCLPTTDVNFVVRYTCNDSDISSTFTFSLLDELSSRI